MAVPHDVAVCDGSALVRLEDIDPYSVGGLTEGEADARLAGLQAELRDLHDLMMAAETHGLLLVLQGMDAAGKDVTIENVHGALNPQAARVKAFKPPSDEESKHHFLWRADAATPMRGEAVTFDRSYYEQAMPPGLGGDVEGDALERRFAHINAFEHMLVDEGIIIVKILLHVGSETQQQRLEERQQEIGQAWKLSASDWIDRRDWDAYMAAYERLVNACGTTHAPWYVVPANHRWYHNYAVASVVASRLRPYREEWLDRRREIGQRNRQEAREARSSG